MEAHVEGIGYEFFGRESVMRTVVGIDPSLTATAVCWLNEGEKMTEVTIYSSKPAKGLYDRMERYRRLISSIVCSVDVESFIMLEGYSYGSRGRAILDMAEFGGLLREALMGFGRVIEVPPTVLKKFVTGKGNASKTAMVAAITKRWGVQFDTDDEYDAFGLAKVGAAVLGWEKVNKFQGELLEKLR